MIDKREFELGKPSDHEKLQKYLTKKDPYPQKIKTTIIPALQKTFLSLVHELITNDEVSQYKQMMMLKRIREKLEERERKKDELREELASDYVSEEAGSTEKWSIFDEDEQGFLKVMKQNEAKRSQAGGPPSRSLSQSGLSDPQVNHERTKSEVVKGERRMSEIVKPLQEPIIQKTAIDLQKSVTLTGREKEGPPEDPEIQLPSSKRNITTNEDVVDEPVSKACVTDLALESEETNKKKSIMDIIKEKKAFLERETEDGSKAGFNPVKIFGHMLKELSKKRKIDNEDGSSVRTGSRLGRSKRGVQSSKHRVKELASQTQLHKIEEDNEENERMRGSKAELDSNKRKSAKQSVRNSLKTSLKTSSKKDSSKK